MKKRLKLCRSSKEGGRGFAIIQDCVDPTSQVFKKYIKNKEKLTASNSNINRNNLRTKSKTIKTRKQIGKEDNCINTSGNKLRKLHT